jgi:hypothetical protein
MALPEIGERRADFHSTRRAHDLLQDCPDLRFSVAAISHYIPTASTLARAATHRLARRHPVAIGQVYGPPIISCPQRIVGRRSAHSHLVDQTFQLRNQSLERRWHAQAVADRPPQVALTVAVVRSS